MWLQSAALSLTVLSHTYVTLLRPKQGSVLSFGSGRMRLVPSALPFHLQFICVLILLTFRVALGLGHEPHAITSICKERSGDQQRTLTLCLRHEESETQPLRSLGELNAH